MLSKGVANTLCFGFFTGSLRSLAKSVSGSLRLAREIFVTVVLVGFPLKLALMVAL